MRVNQRIARLEDRLLCGINRDGTCRYCAGREDELGKIVILHDPPESDDMVRLGLQRVNPPPTLCPACGRDLNTTMVVTRPQVGAWLAREEWAAPMPHAPK